MAEISKPTDINKIWASSGTITVPSDGKISTGNIVEKPAYDYFNYWMNKADTFNAHVNQHGIVMWDSATEYQTEKSYIMGSDGVIYRCILTHTNKNPVTAPDKDTYWKVAFADYGTSYTKAEADTKYLAKASNLSDVTNQATARNNLSVYSIAQMDSALAGKQPLDATLTALAGVTTAADKLVYAAASDTFTTTDFSSHGRDLVASASASATKTLLGVIGHDQTWQDVTASRAVSTTYTNSTGKPIMVSVIPTAYSNKTSYLTIGGVVVSALVYGTATVHAALVGIVPAGATYKFNSTTTLDSWLELR